MKSIERRLLIVEDDKNFRETMSVEFADRGYQVESASSLSDLEVCCKSVFDFAVVDMKLGSESGIEANKSQFNAFFLTFIWKSVPNLGNRCSGNM